MAGETDVLGEKPVTVPLCPPLMSRVLERHRTRSSAASDHVEPWHGLASMGFYTVIPRLTSDPDNEDFFTASWILLTNMDSANECVGGYAR